MPANLLFLVALGEVFLITSWPTYKGPFAQEALLVCLCSLFLAIPSSTAHFIHARASRQSIIPHAWNCTVFVRRTLMSSVLLSRRLLVSTQLLLWVLFCVFSYTRSRNCTPGASYVQSANLLSALSVLFFGIAEGLLPLVLFWVAVKFYPFQREDARDSVLVMTLFWIYCLGMQSWA